MIWNFIVLGYVVLNAIFMYVLFRNARILTKQNAILYHRLHLLTNKVTSLEARVK